MNFIDKAIADANHGDTTDSVTAKIRYTLIPLSFFFTLQIAFLIAEIYGNYHRDGGINFSLGLVFIPLSVISIIVGAIGLTKSNKFFSTLTLDKKQRSIVQRLRTVSIVIISFPFIVIAVIRILSFIEVFI